jgi:hypothetical protein
LAAAALTKGTVEANPENGSKNSLNPWTYGTSFLAFLRKILEVFSGESSRKKPCYCQIQELSAWDIILNL